MSLFGQIFLKLIALSPLLLFPSFHPSLPPSCSGWLTCRPGEKEDGVLQQQPGREEDQQRCRVYPLYGASATV